LLGDFRQAVFAAGNENQINAPAGQFQCQRPTDAARRARDECAAIGKLSLGHPIYATSSIGSTSR
jgi:hypothetical protein